MTLRKLTITRVLGADTSRSGDRIGIKVATEQSGEVMLSLPAELAAGMLIAVQDAGSDAEMRRGMPNMPLHAEGYAVMPSQIPGQDLLIVRAEGGLNLRFLVPKQE